MAGTHNHLNPTLQAFPGTPGIREVRSDSGSESFGFSGEPEIDRSKPVEQGIRRVSHRAEIDTSPPFGSVQEAVTWFDGRGSWHPFYKLREAYNGTEEFDIKKVEEQAAKLEKDLIVKELETLDVLEALGSTKRIVEDLKRQLQQEALKCMATPDLLHSDIKEMNQEHDHKILPKLSPDSILMEAKLSLGKTVNDLGAVRSSVESLNKKLKKEKTFLTRAVSLAKELKQMRMKLQIPDEGETFGSGFPGFPRTVMEGSHLYPESEQVKTVSETRETRDERNKICLRTAEMRLVAARKMEEAAKAAELVAMAEMEAICNRDNENFPGFKFPEHLRSSLTPKTQTIENLSVNLLPETGIFKHSVLRKIDEATVEVKQSKSALEEALNRIDLAHRKQLVAEDALRRWIPGKDQNSCEAKSSCKLNNHTGVPLFNHLNNLEPVDEVLEPVLKQNVSMRNVLNKKQVQPGEDSVSGTQNAGNTAIKNANLGDMLNELKGGVRYPTRAAEKDGNAEKQFMRQRRRFGFIHISLPLSKQSKKKTQASNMV